MDEVNKTTTDGSFSADSSGCACCGGAGCSNDNCACHNKKECSCQEKAQKINELENNWKRAIADYKNLERRFNEDRDSLVKFSNFVLIERIIPVLDNLETLCGHLKDQALIMITKELSSVLKDEGVEEIEAQGKYFDPHSMEASEVVEDEEDNKVVKVVLKGYRLHDRVLRPARVIVGKKKS